MGTRHFQARRKRALAVSDYHLVKMTSLVFRLVFVGQTQFKLSREEKNVYELCCIMTSLPGYKIAVNARFLPCITSAKGQLLC